MQEKLNNVMDYAKRIKMENIMYQNDAASKKMNKSKPKHVHALKQLKQEKYGNHK